MTDFVTIEGRALKQAMRPICSVVERKCHVPILGYVRLSLDKSGLKITGTNLENEITASLDVIDGSGVWSVCVNGHTLASIAAAAGVMPVRIEPGSEDATITLDDGAAIYTVSTLPSDEFPSFGHERAELIETFTNGMLAIMLDKVKWCISSEETRYYLNGVAWQIGKDGRRFVATDGHRLAACRYSSEEGQDASRIIPRRAVEIIATHLSGKDVKVFATTVSTVLDIVSPGITLRTKLIDGTFPDWKRVVPKEDAFKFAFAFNRDEIIAAINQATAIGVERGRAIKFAPDDGRVAIERHDPEFGSAKVKTSTAWPAKAEEFGFNSHYFRVIATACQTDFTLHMAGQGMPFSIADSDETMTRLIMPMRV